MWRHSRLMCLTSHEVPGCYRRPVLIRRPAPRPDRRRGGRPHRRRRDRARRLRPTGQRRVRAGRRTDGHHQHHQDRGSGGTGQSAQARRILCARSSAGRSRPRRRRGPPRRGNHRGARGPPTNRCAVRRPARRAVRAGTAVTHRRRRAAGRLGQPALVSRHRRARPARRRHPQRARSERDPCREPGSDPGIAGPHPRRLPGAVGDRTDGLHRGIGGRLGGQPANRGRRDRAGRRRQRIDRRFHRRRGQDRRRQRRTAFPGVGRAAHRHHHAGLRGGQLPRQCAGRCRRGSPCRATLYRQAVCRDRHHRGGHGELTRLLGRRRRHRLRLVRIAGRQGPRRRGHGQRRVAQAVRQQGQPGVRRQQRGVADRSRASSRPAECWRTCAGSTPRSTRPGCR